MSIFFLNGNEVLEDVVPIVQTETCTVDLITVRTSPIGVEINQLAQLREQLDFSHKIR